jgi:hypothetical protein
MLAKRAVTLLGLTFLCVCPLLGCSSKPDGVDAPLTTNAGPPPPRPNKPNISPSGGGGAPAAGSASSGQKETP